MKLNSKSQARTNDDSSTTVEANHVSHTCTKPLVGRSTVKQKLLISFSGGRTSAYMTWWLLKNMSKKYEMVVVFANTGKEREETLEFVNMCDRTFNFKTVWVEAVVNPKNGEGTKHKVVDFYTANRNGKPFENVIAKYGIPNQNAMHCTRELKTQPIKSYARSIGWSAKDYEVALGIRSDEPHRLKWANKIEHKLLYFAEIFNVTKSDVNLFWSKQIFDLKLKSYEGNCDLCYKKELRKLMTITVENPNKFDKWWRKMETKYGNFVPQSRIEAMEKKGKTVELPIKFFRYNMTVDDIIEESKFSFELAEDESKKIDKYKQLQLFNTYLDANDGCTNSCEVFS